MLTRAQRPALERRRAHRHTHHRRRSTRREEIVRIPARRRRVDDRHRRCARPGEDRRPLVVISHGSPADSSQRSDGAASLRVRSSSWFVSRGYVVALPLRRGYGETGGAWAESYGPCEKSGLLRCRPAGRRGHQGHARLHAQATLRLGATDRSSSASRRAAGRRVALVEPQPAGRAGHGQLRRRTRRPSEACRTAHRQLRARTRW